MKKLKILSCVLLAAAAAGCQNPPSPTSPSVHTDEDNRESFAQANAERQANGEPPMTWQQYLEYAHPVSMQMPPPERY